MMDVINHRGQLIFGRIKNSLLAPNGHANIWNIIQINLLILVIQLSSIQCSLQNGLCPHGNEGFVLATNVRLNANVYYKSNTLNVTECTRRCRKAGRCKSLMYHRNLNETSCNLMEENTTTRNTSHSVELSPHVGTYYLEKVCLKNTCERLFVVEWFQGATLDGHDDKVVLNITRTQCMDSCLSQTQFVCRSAEYDDRINECRLSRFDRYSRPNLFRKDDKHINYFDNTCAYKPVNGGTVAEILLLGNVQHPFSISEFYGLSVSECGDMCLKNQLYPCRSFLFGRKSGQAYCGLTHQNRAVLMDNPGSFESSQSLNYYEIARSVDGCDTSDVHFELLSGLFLPNAPYKVTRDLPPQECLKLCRSEINCRSVNIDYKKGICELNSQNLRTPGNERNLKSSTYFNYFEKVCLSTASVCRRDWAFERVKGKELVGIPHEKLLVEASTREECETACLEYKQFVCRSAEFNYQMNECRISPYNRFSSMDKRVKLEPSRTIIDYLENNCAHEAKGFCNWKATKQHRLLLADRILLTDTPSDCESECMTNENFVCRSFTFDSGSQTCALSHHSKRSLQASAVIRNPSSIYYEISTCFDVSVDCEPDVMRAKVTSNSLFNGKIYTRERPHSCFLDIDNSMEFSLPILLKGDDCGTLEEAEGQFNNVLVIQSNDQVVTSFDKAVGVKCSYDVGNKTGETSLHIKELKLTDRQRGSPRLPDLSFHIMDVKGYEKEHVNLGELLRVQIRMSDEDTYGIFIRNLVAKDGTGYNNITLIDNSGCPVEAKMMREVRTIDKFGKSLESYFEAFSFTGSSTLELEADVETCLDKCRPVQCKLITGRSDDNYETVSSFGKRKKRSKDDQDKAGDIVETTKLIKVLSIESQDFGIGLKQSPLKTSTGSTNFKKVYRGPNKQSPKTSSSTFTYEIDEYGYLCFEPSALATMSGATLLIQGCLFTVALMMAAKYKKDDTSSHFLSMTY